MILTKVHDAVGEGATRVARLEEGMAFFFFWEH